MLKNVIITGAKEGIGKEIAKKLQGKYNLFLIDIQNISKEELPENAEFFNCNVADLNKFKEVIETIIKDHGEIQAIINNAGVMNLSLLEEQDPEIIHEMLHTNILGVINGTSLVIESMKRNKSGTIINIASTAGKNSYTNHAVYCGTKHGVRGFSKTMRKELAKYNIRVSIVSPGAVFTDLAKNGKTSEKYMEIYLKWRDESKAYISVGDVANAVNFVMEQPQNVIIREISLTSIKQTE